MKKLLLCGLSLVLVAGCAISQKVQPVTLSTRSICLINNEKVRPAFRDAIKTRLEGKGYNVRVVPAETTATECPSRLMYSANWTWDLAMYMRRAQLIVFEGDRMAGRADYDASNGGTRPDKFINAETKVNELIDQLFPM